MIKNACVNYNQFPVNYPFQQDYNHHYDWRSCCTPQISMDKIYFHERHYDYRTSTTIKIENSPSENDAGGGGGATEKYSF
ncbi:hypothetical protein DOY81_009313 [Sarcophaga bullata]|nr:hypothetical protein DOY81_009313 [Sarcophaga bullata]